MNLQIGISFACYPKYLEFHIVQVVDIVQLSIAIQHAGRATEIFPNGHT